MYYSVCTRYSSNGGSHIGHPTKLVALKGQVVLALTVAMMTTVVFVDVEHYGSQLWIAIVMTHPQEWNRSSLAHQLMR